MTHSVTYNRAIPWNNIKWEDFPKSYNKILFPNNVEAEITEAVSELSFTPHISYYSENHDTRYTLRFYDTLDDLGLFLMDCYDVYKFLKTQKFIVGEIEFSINITSNLTIDNKRVEQNYNKIEIRFEISSNAHGLTD